MRAVRFLFFVFFISHNQLGLSFFARTICFARSILAQLFRRCGFFSIYFVTAKHVYLYTDAAIIIIVETINCHVFRARNPDSDAVDNNLYSMENANEIRDSYFFVILSSK